MRRLNRPLVWLVVGVLMVFVPVTASAQQTAGRTLQFAGREWFVKAGMGLGPGANNWSDSPESVWVDETGRLHLRIRQIDGAWYSAEVFSAASAGYGRYRFYVDSPVNDLDINVVLGLFLYQDDTHEIDVEVARWGQIGAPNAQFVVQPYDLDGHRERFFLSYIGPVVFEFDWQPESIRFRAIQGTDPEAGLVVNDWTFTQPDVPAPDDLRIHLNLWLLNPPVAPSNGQEVEIIIANVEAPSSVDCSTITLNDAYVALADAQNALDGGNTAAALTAITQARQALQAIEQACGGDITPPPPTPQPPTATLPATPVFTVTPPPPPTEDGGVPTITMTAGDNQVSGTVSPATYCTGDYAVALYAHTDMWYVQPFADSRRYIRIDQNCNWQASTHFWRDMIAAHLVPATASIPFELLTTSCPPLSGGEALASVCVFR